MTTFLNWAIAGCLVGITYLLMLNLIDKLQAAPIRVQIVGPVALAENGATLRQAGNSIAHSVFSGTSLVASVIQAATRKEDSERHH